MKIKRLFVLTTTFLLIAANIPVVIPSAVALQQPDTIAISPTQGPPGTVVTLSIIYGDGWAACYAGDASLGPVTTAVTYTIPLDVEVGRQMKFFCDNGPNATRKIFSNIVWFTITAPVDSDGDTVPDSEDTCPNDPGEPQWAGCPDADGDGLPTQNDQCPYEYGPVENGGCPVEPEFTMPTSGPCVIATYGQVVNVRRGPSLEEDVVGSLYAEQLYYVIGQTQRADGTWWQLDAGWVAGFAVQYGGYCSEVPETGPVTVIPSPTPPADSDNDGLPDNQDQCPFEPGPATNHGCPEPVGVTLVDSRVDLSVALAECPQLMQDVQSLPIHLQLYTAYGRRQISTCEYVERLLAELVFGETGPPLSDENAQAIMDECPDVLPALVGMMERLRGINPNAWQILDGVMTPDNACTIARAIAESRIPPEFGNALMGTAVTPAGSGGSLLSYSREPRYAVPSDALIDTAIAVCIVAPVSLDRAIAIRERIKAAGIQDTELFATPCAIVSFFAEVGDLSSAQQLLFELVRDECGADTITAYWFAEFAQAVAVDFAGLLAVDPATLCADPWGAVAANLKDPATDPNVSPAMLVCTGIAYHLQSYAGELSLYELWVILSAPDPCTTAVKFFTIGALDAGDQAHPLPACFDVGANTVTLADATVLTGASPWAHKIAVLSRPPGTICDGMALAPADSDEDGLTDDVDLCPEEFALTVNGCPGGVAPNTAPTIDPIADQALMEGMSIDIAVAAGDADADPVTINATSGNPAIVSVAVAANILTVTGVAVGNTTINVSATDGIDTTDIFFNVTVNAVAPNTPPAINPIADQTVQAGASINVLLAVSDADGDPLTLTAASADVGIAGVSLAGTTLTITGVAMGTTAVTVIVGDGSTTVGTTFNVNVTFAAPPPATPELVEPGPVPGDGGLADTVAQQAADAGLMTDLDQYGLLDLPGEFVLSPTSAFQATAGIGQPVNIFVIVGGEISQLFENSAESNSFPALDPTGDLLAFLTTDAANNVTLRVMNIPNNVSLPILTTTANWTVGPYPPAWSPDGDHLLVTLVNSAGVPGVYEVDISDPTNIPEPTLLVNNATSASFSPNGHYLAFEQIDPSGNSSIYVMATANPAAAHPITNQPPGASCRAPMFGADSVSLFFVCEVSGQQTLYRYGVQGLTLLDVGVPGVANPVPGPGVGFVGFDDGTTIYYGYDDGSRVVPMLRLQNLNASHMRWTTLADVE